jgi:hypothetical protein
VRRRRVDEGTRDGVPLSGAAYSLVPGTRNNEGRGNGVSEAPRFLVPSHADQGTWTSSLRPRRSSFLVIPRPTLCLVARFATASKGATP